ncbi:probable methyltransferase-like protein 24 [Daphnia carinata]|uniref:probable methyltransferase-like protein 24 n=1 Tax=Daphnia carinata TaxID=120202 RepID=UPI002579C0C6|nr:probable methyltransferase-like protein 24 [Daphnia carinata]
MTRPACSITRRMCDIKKRTVLMALAFLFTLILVYVRFYVDARLTITSYISNLRQEHRRADANSPSYWDALLDSDTLTGNQIMEYFLWSNRPSCQLVHDFGGTLYANPSGMDGQKSVCIDPQVAPKPDDCLVYSFGIKNEWSFDEQMSHYGCEVFAFDPSMGKEPHDHMPGDVHFYNWGIGDRDKHEVDSNWKIRSLSSIYEELSVRHGRKIIDYLKMDIEATEWQVLPDIIRSGMLSNIRQLGVEIHLVTDAPLDKYRELAKLLRSMENMGMVRFDSEYNPWFLGDFVHLQLWKHTQGYEIAWYNGNLSRPATPAFVF